MNYNFYEYCKAISKPYYPRIYTDINISIEKVTSKVDKEKLYPFPYPNDFQDLVNDIFCSYKKLIYEEVVDGRISCANYSDNNVIKIIKDLISILLIQKIIENRETFKNHPYYY